MMMALRGFRITREERRRAQSAGRRAFFKTALCALLFALCSSRFAGAEEVTLLYTGGTQSFLEVCGCTDNQLGGVARRATIVRELKRAHPNVILLDAGDLFAGDTDLDRLRCRVHLESMKEMGYDVVNVGRGEFRFGRGFFDVMRDSGGVAFVSANVKVNGDRVVPDARILDVGGVRVGVVGVAGERALETHTMGMGAHVKVVDGVETGLDGVKEAIDKVIGQVDLLVLLSDLDRDAERNLVQRFPGIDVVIGARSLEVIERVGNTLFLGTQAQGKAVGHAVLTVADNQVTKENVRQVFVSESIVEDGTVKQLVDGFYDRVQESPELQLIGRARFDGFVLEAQVGQGANGYVGVEACKGCHSAETVAWEQTHHAGAFNRLLQQQKHYQPDCVTCHTTGFGYPTGFQIGKDAKHLTNVQCEVCHGPGGQHARRPEARNIRRTPSPDLCQRCHDADQTPDFDAHFAQMLAEVSHTGGGAEYVEKHEKPSGERGRDGRTLVELFVMADCPYGIRAEQMLEPMFRQAGDQIDFRLHFIADEAGVDRVASPVSAPSRSGPGCEATTTSGTGRFRSLHGDAEIAEGIRQTIVMRLYPERFWDYILCRNRSGITTDWRVCATQVGMDVARIAEMAESTAGGDLFAENIRRANILGINASPTLHVNGREVSAFSDPDAVAQAICRDDVNAAFCAEVADCRSDQDCVHPSKVGICVDGGTPQARCEFRSPVSFRATVVNDSTCVMCETYPFVRSTLALFPGAAFNTVDVNSAEGQDLVARYGLDRVPSFVLDGAFAQAARFGRFVHTVRSVGDGFVPDVRMTPIAQILNGRDIQGIDLFLDMASPNSLGLAERMLRWVGEVDAPYRLRLHFLGDGEDNVLFRRAQEAAPGRVADALLCRIRGVYKGELLAMDCFQRTGIVISGEGSVAQTLANARALGVLPGMAPAVVIDGQFVLQANGLSQVESFFYRLHPELAQRDRNSSGRSNVK